MSTSTVSSDRRLASISRSIDVITERANRIYLQYAGCESDENLEQLRSVPIDDNNIDLQCFFQYLERILQIDLKNRRSLLNNKGNYWNFFALALKDSKGLYDSVLYVANSTEVKTVIGRGRLFLRFCLQHHRLGDVIQQSFMMNKYVHQFYADDCFWKKSDYLDRIIQALYQLNDVQFDLINNGQYQLDICWPSIESSDGRLKNSTPGTSRLRTDSISSCLSMESLSSQSILTSSIPIASSYINSLDASNHNESILTQSLSSLDEYPENSLLFWKERCQQLENRPSSNDAQTQSSLDQQDQTCQTNDDEDNPTRNERENFECELGVLKDEINILNFQLSSARIHQTHNEQKIKDAEREMNKQQTTIQTKTNEIGRLQTRIDEQDNRMKEMRDEHASNLKRQEQRIEQLVKENERIEKLLEDERKSFEKERNEQKKVQEELELNLREKTLDFEEMKRRLVKAIKEKADLFSSIYNYEIKLEEEQSKQLIHEDDVRACSKCQTVFGWTLKKYRCRSCQKIFCYYCSNHSKPGPSPSAPQHRLCDLCYEIYIKESLRSDYTVLDNPNEPKSEIDLNFRVRSEPATTDPAE